MAKVEIYTNMWCPFCHRARQILREKGVAFIEIDIEADPPRRQEMIERADGQRTVPQIFINEVSIGGADDLAALESRGALDAMLTEA